MTRPQATDRDELIAHIRKHVGMLAEIESDVRSAVEIDVPKIGRTPRAAVLVAGLIENYYTCAETVFVRISRFFENNLSPERWHKELLDRMTLAIEGIRPRVLGDESTRDLVELLRFRHFRRYYFGSAYDWDRIDELITRIHRTHPRLVRELEAFVAFIAELPEIDTTGAGIVDEE